jgi:hypothetical protein
MVLIAAITFAVVEVLLNDFIVKAQGLQKHLSH